MRPYPVVNVPGLRLGQESIYDQVQDELAFAQRLLEKYPDDTAEHLQAIETVNEALNMDADVESPLAELRALNDSWRSVHRQFATNARRRMNRMRLRMAEAVKDKDWAAYDRHELDFARAQDELLHVYNWLSQEDIKQILSTLYPCGRPGLKGKSLGQAQPEGCRTTKEGGHACPDGNYYPPGCEVGGAHAVETGVPSGLLVAGGLLAVGAAVALLA
jgi:hypothetical protein